MSALRSAIKAVVHTDKFNTQLTNLGLDLDYLDEPEFAKFWAEDAKRVIEAVDIIGRVQG